MFAPEELNHAAYQSQKWSSSVVKFHVACVIKTCGGL